MCRSIKRLRTPEGPPTDDQIEAAALQFIRKISGYHKPSRATQEAFERGVAEVTVAARAMLDRMENQSTLTKT